MSKEICISSTPHETRLAILEDDQLTEVYYERENEYTLAGSIYKGRVTRVLPGMQSAFVDLGLERDAFLYVTDFMEEQEDSSDFERIPANGEEAGRPAQGRESQNRPQRAAHGPAEDETGSKTQRRPGGCIRGGKRRRESLRMERVVGVAVVAAARAFGHPKGDSSPLRNRQPQQPARRLPGPPSRPLLSKQNRIQHPALPLHSLCRASRFRSMAVRALPAPPRRRYLRRLKPTSS